jgi:hypothetical protein
VLRRSLAPSAALAVALVLAARPLPAHAAAIAANPDSTNGSSSYRLSNTNPAGTAPVTKVVASVIPPGTVVPPDPSSSPLTILPGSSGFDQSNLQILLGDGKAPNGDPVQAVALDFGTSGFQPGGVLNFSLSLDKAFQGSPDLQLPPSAAGLSIMHVNATGTGSNNGGTGGTTPVGTPDTQVPEPLTLFLWSTGAVGLGLVRACAYRRSLAA